MAFAASIKNNAVRFVMRHGTIDRMASYWGHTLYQMTGGKYRVGVTRAAHMIVEDHRLHRDGQPESLTAKDGILYCGNVKAAFGRDPANMGKYGFEVRDLPVKNINDEDFTPENIAMILRGIYQRPNAYLKEFDIHVNANNLCFGLLNSNPLWDEQGYSFDGGLDRSEYMPMLRSQLGRFPSQMKELFPREINLAVRLKNQLGHTNGSDEFVTVMLPSTLHHELFHYFEANDREAKNPPVHRDHLKRNRPFEYFDDVWDRQGFSSWADHDNPASYVGKYGMTEATEDRAEVAGMLFSENKDYLKTKLADGILRSKVEFLTGCKYDAEKGEFEKLFTPEEMSKEFGLSGYMWYAKWSSLNGKPQMDAQFWNSLIENNSK